MSDVDLDDEADMEDEPAPWDLLADALGSLDEIEDEDEQLDLQESFGAGSSDPDDPFVKVPLGRASNLIRLREAASGVRSGAMTQERFVAVIRPFIQPLENGIDLLDSPAVMSQINNLVEAERTVFDWTYNQLLDLSEGIWKMYDYRESGDLADVSAGMQMVEQAMIQLDNIQDHAIDLAREAALRESLTKPQAWQSGPDAE